MTLEDCKFLEFAVHSIIRALQRKAECPLCRITSDSKLDNLVIPTDSLSCMLNCQSIGHKSKQIMNSISWQFGCVRYCWA